jgi:hypothetical protein
MARPRKTIDEKELLKHAANGYTMKELEAISGVSEDTLNRRFAGAIKKGRSLRNASLRRKQYELAMRGNATMLIWLGKQYLDQSDKPEAVVEDSPYEDTGNRLTNTVEVTGKVKLVN